jgi:acetyl esterase
MSRAYSLDALDPELRQVAAMTPPPVYDDLPVARRMVAQMQQYLPPVDESGVDWDEQHIPGPVDAPDVKVRLYRPERRPQPGAALVFFHWGGFVLGDLTTEHARCVLLAREVGCLVVSVDYRLAPEHPFPHGLEDCYAALQWTAVHADELGVDPARIAVGGTSAGGGLAAAVALLARDRGGPAIALQYLGYPVLDDRMDTASANAFVATPNWTASANRLMWRYYLGAQGGNTSAYAAPAHADDVTGLPPAYLWTAEFDPLRDEGLAYAERLLRAGVAVDLRNYAGTFHGFDQVPGATIARLAQQDQIAALRRSLHAGAAS